MARPHTPWYRTNTARVLAGVVLLIVLVGITVVARSRSTPADLTRRQNDLDQYTGEVRALLQSITPPATEENAVPNRLTPRTARTLKSRSEQWVTELAKAQQTLGQVPPPTQATQTATILFVEAIQLYSRSATTYGLAPATPPKVQVKMLATAAGLRDQATALWQQGTNILDQARSSAKMTPSQLRIPTAGAVAPPSPSPTGTPRPRPSGSGGNKQGGGKSSK